MSMIGNENLLLVIGGRRITINVKNVPSVFCMGVPATAPRNPDTKASFNMRAPEKQISPGNIVPVGIVASKIRKPLNGAGIGSLATTGAGLMQLQSDSRNKLPDSGNL